jgi:hypothetical protein
MRSVVYGGYKYMLDTIYYINFAAGFFNLLYSLGLFSQLYTILKNNTGFNQSLFWSITAGLANLTLSIVFASTGNWFVLIGSGSNFIMYTIITIFIMVEKRKNEKGD